MSTRRLAPLLALALFSAACDQRLPAHGCQADAQCPSGSRCAAGVCAGDTRPTASIAAVGTVEEFSLVRLDGSASKDPDGDLAAHRWAVRSVDAPCEPPEVAGRDPVALVRFGCAGRFEVTLTVTDALGLESDPLRTEVAVQPSTAARLVSAGPDLATDHRCGGSPLRCRPTTAVQLAASAAAGVSLRWTVQPPAGRPLDATRRVTFSPSASAPSPTVEIVTDGTAISGDWIFRVEAVDAYGIVGADSTRVSVRNRPPVVTFTPAGPFEHAFDAASALFTSRGAVAWSVTDPDGDPIPELSGTWRHVGDGDASVFDGDFAGTSVTFAVEVPYLAPGDALRLRGGEGLVRQIELYAVDVNRTTGVGIIPIEIGNRPPVPAGGTFDTSVPHRFDPLRSAYVASVRAGTFIDPDGDPIVDSTGPGLCGTLHASGNDVTAECAVPFEGVPVVDRLVGLRVFPVPARDPWDAATQVPVRTVEIRNSPPTVSSGKPSRPLVCSWDAFQGFPCGVDITVGGIEFDVAVDVSDPDGDPVLVAGSTSPGGSSTPTAMLLKEPGAIPFHFVQQQLTWHCFKGNEPPISTVAATDGTPEVRIGVGPVPWPGGC